MYKNLKITLQKNLLKYKIEKTNGPKYKVKWKS